MDISISFASLCGSDIRHPDVDETADPTVDDFISEWRRGINILTIEYKNTRDAETKASIMKTIKACKKIVNKLLHEKRAQIEAAKLESEKLDSEESQNSLGHTSKV